MQNRRLIGTGCSAEFDAWVEATHPETTGRRPTRLCQPTPTEALAGRIKVRVIRQGGAPGSRAARSSGIRLERVLDTETGRGTKSKRWNWQSMPDQEGGTEDGDDPQFGSMRSR